MYRNIIYGKLVVHGCIHGLECECPVVNIELGDCQIECENRVVWRCPFFHSMVRDML